MSALDEKTNLDKFEETFGFRPNNTCGIFDCEIKHCQTCEYKGFWDKEYKEN